MCIRDSVLSGHALYKTMLEVLQVMVRWVLRGPLIVPSLPVLLALKEWDRKSELSADRGSLLVAQDLSGLRATEEASRLADRTESRSVARESPEATSTPSPDLPATRSTLGEHALKTVLKATITNSITILIFKFLPG